MRKAIIPLFIPHAGCPYQCSFCNQWKITEENKMISTAEVSDKIHTYVQSAAGKYQWEAAFYGGTFTALPLAWQEALLKPAYEAKRKGKIDGIRLSTRPDCLDKECIDLLQSYQVDVVELGVQSLSDHVLRLAKRGHTARDVEQAVERLKAADFQVGIQLMPGLPGENGQTLRQTLRQTCSLQPDMVRIYPVLVMADTDLAAEYQEGKYRPLTMEEAIWVSAWWRMYLAKYNIRVIRMGLQATDTLDRHEDLLAGPYHPAFGEMVCTRIYTHRLRKVLRQCQGEAEIVIHPRDASKVFGNGKYGKYILEASCPEPIKWQLSSDSFIGQARIRDARGVVSIIYEDKIYVQNRQNMIY